MLALLVVFATLLQTAAAAVFESELWPGEGIPVFEAVATQLSLHEQPLRSSQIVRRLAVKPKQRVSFDQTRYRTIKPGTLTVLAPTSIKGRLLADVVRLSTSDYYSSKFPAVAVDVDTGDTVELLQYRAEGTCFVRVAGKTIDAALCPTHVGQFRSNVDPIVEWWIHVTITGKPAGWLLVTDKTVRVADRRG